MRRIALLVATTGRGESRFPQSSIWSTRLRRRLLRAFLNTWFLVASPLLTKCP